MKKTHNGLLNNLSWKFAERITAQLVTLVVSIILARILDPSDYGTIAIVTIFISFANIFVSDGFGSALIVKQDADALDYFSVIYFNLALSILLYLLLFFIAPYISLFYGEGYEILTPVLRVLGLRIILSGINSVQQAYVAKHMIFRKFFVATLLGTILSAVVGIWMAINGYGVWALVTQYLTNTTVDTIVLAISLKKKPQFIFSCKRLKGMLGYGTRILSVALLSTGYQELRALIIGKAYTSTDLAFYDKGRQFPNLIVTNINTSIGAVLFPKMALDQNNIKKIKETTRNSICFSSFIMCPMMLGLAAVAQNFVYVILTEKWLPCVTLLQLFCIIYLFQPIHTANMQAIKALGRGDVYLKLEITKKVIELVVFIALVWISVEAIVIGMAVLTTLFTFVNAFPNKKLINYSFKEQMTDILPAIIMSGIMFGVVYLVGLIVINKIALLAIQIVFGMIVYILLALLSKNKNLLYIWGLIKSKFMRKHKDDIV